MLGPSADELDRARTLLLARWARRIEPMEGKGSALAAAEALEEVGISGPRISRRSGSVGHEEVRAAAARYLQPDNVSAVAYLPRDGGAELTAPALERAFAVTALQEGVRLACIPAPKGARARRHPAVGRWQSEVLHTALPGADLLVRRKAGVPLVTLGMYAPRLEFDPPAQAGLGALTVRSSVRGAGRARCRGSGVRLRAPRRHPGRIGSLRLARLRDHASCPSNLGAAAALLDLVFSAPRLGRCRSDHRARLMVVEAEQVADDMFRYPFQLAFAGAFGDAGYGLPVGGLPETLAAISPAEVRRLA